MWGTFRLETGEGGWEGTWAVQVREQGTWYNALGDGSGDYAGMKMWWKLNYGIGQGEILEQ